MIFTWHSCHCLYLCCIQIFEGSHSNNSRTCHLHQSCKVHVRYLLLFNPTQSSPDSPQTRSEVAQLEQIYINSLWAGNGLISILPAWWLGGERNGAVSPTTCLHNSFKCLPTPGQASLADPLQNLGLHFGKGQSPYCVSWLVYAIRDKWPLLATVFNKSLMLVPNWDNSSLLSSRTSPRPGPARRH